MRRNTKSVTTRLHGIFSRAQRKAHREGITLIEALPKHLRFLTPSETAEVAARLGL